MACVCQPHSFSKNKIRWHTFLVCIKWAESLLSLWMACNAMNMGLFTSKTHPYYYTLFRWGDRLARRRVAIWQPRRTDLCARASVRCWSMSTWFSLYYRGKIDTHISHWLRKLLDGRTLEYRDENEENPFSPHGMSTGCLRGALGVT